MKSYINILTIAIIAAIIMVLPLQAQVLVPNDGWEWDTTSTMTYHNMFFTDSSSVDGQISGEFTFNGDDAGDVGRWTKKFNLKFLPVMKMGMQAFPTNDFGAYFTVELHHKDTIITRNGNSHVWGSSSWTTTVLSDWSGVIDSIDAITIKLFYIAPTSFAKQRIRFDKLRVWTYEQGELLPFYSFGDSGTVQGTIFNDSSGNGAKETAEDGMAGRKVHIAGMQGYWGEYLDTLADSVLTDDLGRYQFKLPHGQYRLWQEVPNGFQQTVPLDTHYININVDTLWLKEANFGNIVTTAKKYAVNRGWNMVSLPLKVSLPSKENIFPSAISEAYWYNGSSYETADTLEPGKGYWVKFPRAQYVFMAGDDLTQNSIQVIEGWNMIGSATQAVLVTDIGSIRRR